MKKCMTLIIIASIILFQFPINTAKASTTSDINAICSQYGFSSGKYWSYNIYSGNAYAYTASTHPAVTYSSYGGEDGWAGYSFAGGDECWAFAGFMGYKLFGQNNPYDSWIKYSSIDAVKQNGLCVGDIIRSDTHSALIYSIDGNGIITVVECWGSVNNKLSIGGYYNGNTDNYWNRVDNSTFDQIVAHCGFQFVLHAPNNTSEPLWPTNLVKYDKLEFHDIEYPEVFKIDTRIGWFLQGGTVVSDVNLTSIRSIIRRVSDGKDIDDTGDIGISGKSYAIKSIDSRVRFSVIDTAGKYAWILIAKDSAGKELRMVMYFEAVTSGTTSTKKRSILNGISDSWPDEYNDDIITPPSSPVYGDTSGSTTFWVRADKANASFVLKSYQGKASVAQHNFAGIYTGDEDEIHYGFYWVSDSTGRSFHWGPDATANKNQLNTNQEISMTFPNPGVYSVTIVPLAYSDVNHYWVMDTINYWKTQAKWIVKSESQSGCKVSFEKLKEVTISFDAGNGVPSGKLPKGQPFDLGGIVKASENIKSVTGTIYDVNTKKAVSGIGTNPVTIYPNSTSVDIYSSNINYNLIFNYLNDGAYRYELVVTTVSGMTKTVANSRFTIGNTVSVRGDANGNGKFELEDLILMLNYYLGRGASIITANCDLNGDGVSCGIEDLIAALNMYIF